jgi:hypothetical protein
LYSLQTQKTIQSWKHSDSIERQNRISNIDTYPETVQIARTITEQEAKLDAIQSDMVHVPSLAKDLLEQISFEARESEFIDNKSGVSARMSITAYETY